MNKVKKLPHKIKEIRNHKPVGVNYAFQKNISYSQLSMYMSCPKRWSLNYKEGQKTYTPNINMVFGTAIHQTLQNYLTIMYNESAVKADAIDIEDYFENAYREAYLSEYNKNKTVHFSDPLEMREFYDDGLEILKYFKSKKGAYFGKRGWWLVGCEIPINIRPIARFTNSIYTGFIDLVLFHEATGKYVIYDFKTSTSSWKASQKKDEKKQIQLVLYKQLFSEQFGVPVDDIEVKFIILKRKLYENVEFAQKRIQEFIPSSGKNKLAKAKRTMDSFIESVFNVDGTFKDVEHKATPSKKECLYCPFRKSEHCSEGI